MAPVNPYLRNKPQKKAPASQSAAPNQGAPTKSVTTPMATKPKPKQAPTITVPIPRPTAPSVTKQRPPVPVLPPSVPKSRPSAPAAPLVQIPLATAAKLKQGPSNKPTAVYSSSKKSLSFKSKLKQEIESLKRAKQLEKERKLQEEERNKKNEEDRRRQIQQIANHKGVSVEQVEAHLRNASEHVYYDAHQRAHLHLLKVMPGYNGPAPTMPANYVTPAKRVIGSISEIPQKTVQQVTPATVASKHSSPPSNVNMHVSARVSSSGSHAAETPLKTLSEPNTVVVSAKSEAVASVKPASNSASATTRPMATIKSEVPRAPSTDKVTNPDAVPSVMATGSESNAVDVLSGVPVKAERAATLMVGNSALSHNAYANAQMPPNFPAAPMNYNMPYGASPYGAMYPPMMIPAAPAPPFGWNPYSPQQYPMMNQQWMQPTPPASSIPTPAPVPKIATQPATVSKPTTSVLHHDPLNPVSPYATTHERLQGEIVIYKKAGESFGVSFRNESQSTLVEPEIADKLNVQVASNKTSVKEVKESGGVNTKLAESSGTGNAANSSTETTTAIAKSTQPIVSVQEKSTAPVPPTAAADKVSHVANQPVKQRRPRRRRVFFGVLTVVNADKQNAQFKTAGSKNNHQLKPGDIILKVNGNDLGGLTFEQAIALFAACEKSADKDSAVSSPESQATLIRCPLVVARRKSRPAFDGRSGFVGGFPAGVAQFGVSVSSLPVPLKIPFVVNTITDQIQSGDFTDAEVLALAQGAIRCILAESRDLGHVAPPQLELACLQSPALSRRDFSSVKAKQNHAIRLIEQSMKELAIAHWANQWKFELQKAGASDLQLSNFTDAQRSALRELPRPTKGCRCGRTDHEYVNDSKCVLYRNLRVLSETTVASDKKQKELKKIKSGNLNAVETAYRDRILKLKAETQREEAEALFVEEMEELQVKKLKVAVFAPSLTAMVLSSVAELAKDISRDHLVVEDSSDGIAPGSKVDTQQHVSTTSPVEHAPTKEKASLPTSTLKESAKAGDADDDDSDDDDIPLASLSKRNAPSPREPEAKRPKVQGAAAGEKVAEKDPNVIKERPSLNLCFLARILRHISKTWGHLYKEPSDADFSWRWEVYHGQTSPADTYRDSKRTNPRSADSRSFENIRFVLNDDVISRLSEATKKSGATTAPGTSLKASNDFLLMSYLLSSRRTGVYDEMMALMKMGILRRTISGCAVLAKDWASQVDPLVLNDMDQHWCKRQDPTNKHRICRSMRSELERSWMRVNGGWAISDDLDDIIYRDNEWDEWRTHFQARFDSQINDTEGIEKFGI